MTAWGKLVIIVPMLPGRARLLTAAMALMTRARKARTYNFGREEVIGRRDDLARPARKE